MVWFYAKATEDEASLWRGVDGVTRRMTTDEGPVSLTVVGVIPPRRRNQTITDLLFLTAGSTRDTSSLAHRRTVEVASRAVSACLSSNPPIAARRWFCHERRTTLERSLLRFADYEAGIHQGDLWRLSYPLNRVVIPRARHLSG